MNAVIKKYNCVVCQSAIALHDKTNYSFCQSCSILNFKNDNNGSLEIGKGKVIKEPTNFIKIGTKGSFNNKEFEVVGRIRLWFDNETESYWTIVFNDDTIQVLKVFEGFYSILKPLVVDFGKTNFSLANFNKKTPYKINENISCSFIDKRVSNLIDVEGEFYFPKFFDEIKLYQFSCDSNHKILLFNTNFNDYSFFEEELIDVDSFNFTNTNNIISSNANCSKCKAPVVIKDYENTDAFACVKCSAHNFYEDQTNKAQEKNEIDAVHVCFNLNDELEFDNIKYNINGIAIKQDYTIYKSKWREYNLYNNKHGYAFLNEYNGHWIFVKKQWNKDDVEAGDGYDKLNFDIKTYELFNSYTYKTVYAAGEFSYNVFKSNEIKCYEYIHPPYLLSKEKSKDNIDWFVGKHIDRKEVKKQCKKHLPHKTGIGAIEPKGLISGTKILMFCLVFMFITFFAHMLTTIGLQNKELINTEFAMPDSTQIFNQTITDVKLNKAYSNIDIYLTAPLDNNWLEVSAQLINTADGTEYNVEQGLEYYSGYEDGESWSEGSKTDEIHLSQIPRGNYVLKLQATQNSNMQIKYFSVRAVYDSAIDRNLIFTMFGILLLGFIFYCINYYYNYNRWQESPYFLNKYPPSQNA